MRLGDSTVLADCNPNPEPPGRPTHRVRPGVADRRGGGVRTLLPGRGQPAQRSPDTRIRPPCRRPVSQPRLHPAPQPGAAPALHLHLLPAPPQTPELSKPLVFVLSLRRPQGAGRVTPRGGILSPSFSGSEKKNPCSKPHYPDSPSPFLFLLALPSQDLGWGMESRFQPHFRMKPEGSKDERAGRRAEGDLL